MSSIVPKLEFQPEFMVQGLAGITHLEPENGQIMAYYYVNNQEVSASLGSIDGHPIQLVVNASSVDVEGTTMVFS